CGCEIVTVDAKDDVPRESPRIGTGAPSGGKGEDAGLPRRRQAGNRNSARGAANADLIVIDLHGQVGLQKMFLGSTTERVLRETTVAVLVTRDRSTRRQNRKRCVERRAIS